MIEHDHRRSHGHALTGQPVRRYQQGESEREALDHSVVTERDRLPVSLPLTSWREGLAMPPIMTTTRPFAGSFSVNGARGSNGMLSALDSLREYAADCAPNERPTRPPPSPINSAGSGKTS